MGKQIHNGYRWKRDDTMSTLCLHTECVGFINIRKIPPSNDWDHDPPVVWRLEDPTNSNKHYITFGILNLHEQRKYTYIRSFLSFLSFNELCRVINQTNIQDLSQPAPELRDEEVHIGPYSIELDR